MDTLLTHIECSKEEKETKGTRIQSARMEIPEGRKSGEVKIGERLCPEGVREMEGGGKAGVSQIVK